MNSYTVAELSRSPSAILAEREPSVITNSGKVQNLIVNVSDMDIDEAVRIAQGIRAHIALERLRASGDLEAREALTPEDIENEVAAVRKAQ